MKIKALIVSLMLVAALAAGWDVYEGDDYIVMMRSADYYEGRQLEPPTFALLYREDFFGVIVEFGGPKIAFPRDLRTDVLVQLGDGSPYWIRPEVSVTDDAVLIDIQIALDIIDLHRGEWIRIGTVTTAGDVIHGEWLVSNYNEVLRRFLNLLPDTEEELR